MIVATLTFHCSRCPAVVSPVSHFVAITDGAVQDVKIPAMVPAKWRVLNNELVCSKHPEVQT